MKRPDEFWVAYGDKQILFIFLPHQGYLYKCPKGNHRSYNWIDTESGSRHKITFNARGEATVEGSLLCPQRCGWHVRIAEGVAYDV